MRLSARNLSSVQFLCMLFAIILVAAPLAGCAGAQEEAAGDHAEAAGEHAEGEGEHAEAAGEGGDEDGHVHPAGDDTPSRADEEDRDEFSKPLEVYAVSGIGEGSTVVDVGAGSGYNTFLVSGVVGDAGTVFAIRGNDGLAARLEHGDMSERSNVTMHGSTSEVPDGTVDSVLLIREYHLADDRPAVLAEAMRMLKPGGTVAVVEVRLGPDAREGYNHDVHRSGEDTIIAEFAEGGFELAEESDLLYVEGDDYGTYGGPTNVRYATDRMLLVFRKSQ